MKNSNKKLKILKSLFITFSLFSLLNINGCGQKGPLYLPTDNPADKTQEQDNDYFLTRPK